MKRDDFKRLQELVKSRPMTATERDRQRVSFAYGNAKLENEALPRSTVERAAERKPNA